ncbi:MAG: hypothetical protein ACT4NY_14415, partial [Pseudonocardiales bacterium]
SLGILEPILSAPSRSRRNGTDTWPMHAHGGCWAEVIDRTVTQGGLCSTPYAPMLPLPASGPGRRYVNSAQAQGHIIMAQR